MVLLILKLFLVLGFYFVGFFAVILIGYVAYRDVGKILQVFERSTIIVDYAGESGRRGFFERFTLVTIITGVVARPSKHIRRGALDPNELGALPLLIRKRMQWAFRLSIVAFVWAVLSLLYVKFIR